MIYIYLHLYLNLIYSSTLFIYFEQYVLTIHLLS